MNRQQRRAAGKASRPSDGRFSLAKLRPMRRMVNFGEVANSYFYEDTSICVTVGSAPVPVGETSKDHTKMLVISFSDHIPGRRMSEMTQYQLLLSFGMLKPDETPDALNEFAGPKGFDPVRSQTSYYYRPVSECWYSEENLQKAYVDGTITLNNLWAAARAAEEAMS